MHYARGGETLPFAAAIREGRRRMDGLPLLTAERRVYSYIERGLYAEQVRRVLALFPLKQVLFLRSKDLWDDHVATLARIAAFLGISPFPDTGAKREFVRPDVPFPSVPTEADRALVADLVRNDVREFAAFTNLGVSDWPVMQEAPAVAPRMRHRAATEKR
jgi:Sulfotransferase domain